MFVTVLIVLPHLPNHYGVIPYSFCVCGGVFVQSVIILSLLGSGTGGDLSGIYL